MNYFMLAGVAIWAFVGIGVVKADQNNADRKNEENIQVASRLVDVKALGAKGDGATDDTAAIQGAFDALAGSGGTVYFPEGNYRVTKRLLLTGSHARVDKTIDYIEVRGAGKNSSRLLGDGVDYILAAADVVNEKTGKRDIVHGMTVRDLTFANLRQDGKSRSGGIDVSYMIRWSVRDCQFIGLATGIYSTERANMVSENHDSLAVYIIRIQNNVFYGCSDYAVKLGRIFDLSIENNEIEHGSGGIQIGVAGDGFDAAANNVRVINNLIEGLGGDKPAISGSCWIGSQIVGNYFEANQGGDIELITNKTDGWSRALTINANCFQPTKEQRERAEGYGPIKLVRVLSTVISANFTTGSYLIHPNSVLGERVNIVSNTLNNPPEIGDIRGARPGSPSDYIGELKSGAIQQSEQWTVSGPLASVGIHSLYGFRFEPRGDSPRSIGYATRPPEGKDVRHQMGDILLNSKPTISLQNKILIGWSCLESGSPGVWKPLLVETQP